MARLGLFSAALLLELAAPATAQVDRWAVLINEASLRFGLPETWIRQVMAVESGGRTMVGQRPIISRAGAMGLMQLMPATWSDMRRIYRLGPDPFDPRDNILAGTAYLRAMYDRFGYPGLFAAYNGGPQRYAGHLASGRPLPRETVDYLAKVVKTDRNLMSYNPPTAQAAKAGAVLFVQRSTASEFGGVAKRNGDPLFAILQVGN